MQRLKDKVALVTGAIDAPAQLACFTAGAIDETATAASVAATVERFGGLHVLFANAGTEGAAKPLEQMTVAEFREPFETNVLGVWLSIKHAAAQAAFLASDESAYCCGSVFTLDGGYTAA